jgi:hypothetical protein
VFVIIRIICDVDFVLERAEELAKEQKMLEDAWKQKPTIDKSKDEEFEEYFDGLFM